MKCLINVYILEDTINKDGKEILLSPKSVFLTDYEPEWLDDELSKEIMLDIDDIVFNDGDYLKHRDYGSLSPRELSGGTSTLLLLYKGDLDKYIVKASNMGPNCFKHLEKIAEEKEVYLYLDYVIPYDYFPIKFKCIETGLITDDYFELYKERSRVIFD